MTMDSKLVAVSGKAGSGKDYVTDILVDMLTNTYGVSAVKIPWALRVREEIEEMLGVLSPQLYHKPTTPDIRALLQFWGTDYRRGQDPDYWVKEGMRLARESYAEVIFFPDTRFHNEANAVRLADGMSVRVDAPKFRRENRIGKTREHASETDADSLTVDFVIDNSKDKRPKMPSALFSWLVARP